MSWKSFQKIRKLLNFQKATIKPTIQEIPRRKSNGTEVRGEKLLKFSVHLVRLSSSPEILLRKRLYIRHWKTFREFKWEFFIHWKSYY